MPYQVETSTGPFLAVTLSYFVLLAVIGWWGNRQNKNLRDFFTMSGSAGAILAGLAYFSTQYSMSTFMGVPGSIYHVGYAGMSVSVPGIAFSMIIPALLVGRKLIRLGHRYGMLTMADYLADRYESTGLRDLHRCTAVGGHRRHGRHGNSLLHGRRHPLGHDDGRDPGRSDGLHGRDDVLRVPQARRRT